MKYKITYQENGKIKSKKVDGSSLDNENLPNIISIKKEFFSFEFKKRISNKQIKNILYELNLMLESKILLDEAFNILIKKQKNENLKDFIEVLQLSFSTSKSIKKSLQNFSIDPLVIGFFEITLEKGYSDLTINSLYKIVNDNYEIKKEFLKTMTYPIVLSITFLFSLVGIFKFVVPNFKGIILQSNLELSFATQSLFFLESVFNKHFSLMIALLILLFFFIYIFYKRYSKIQDFLEKVLVKNIVLISKLYRLKKLYLFFVGVDILLRGKYEFLDAISKSKVLLNNKYLFDRITQIENLLKSGKSISLSFESTKLFDEIDLSLLKTAEVSNSTESVICEIKNIYKKRFDDSLKLFSLLIEPLFFIIIMALILWIILAVFVPLWSMNDMLRL